MAPAFRLSDHICALYETEREQLATATAYVVEGLRAGERCFYVADSPAALERFRMSLAIVGVNAEAMVKQGALVEATKAEAHLEGGYFDCERMLHLLQEALDSALRDGFSGLRACGDMTWLLDGAPGSEHLARYEALINQVFDNREALWMCQYDRRRLPADLIDHALATHPSAVLDGQHLANPFYEEPATAITRTARPADLDGKLSELRRRF